MTQTNLKTVLKQLMSSPKLSANALAKSLNLPTPTIQRLLTGEVQDPRSTTLVAIADYFDISIDQLLGREALVRKLHKDIELAIRPPNSIPIFSLTDIVTEMPNKTSANWLKWQNQNHSRSTELEKLFAVSIKNNLYEPIFYSGTFLIINPIIKAQSGDYVLVKFSNDQAPIIKKFISEGDHKYLYSLKSEIKTINLKETKCTLIGIIIESYVNFKSIGA